MNIKTPKGRLLSLLIIFTLISVMLSVPASSTGSDEDNNSAVTPPSPSQDAAVAHAINVSPDIARIIDRGELIVATTISDQPPMYWQSHDGTLCGPEMKLAQGLADALGVKLTILRWSDDYSELQNAVIGGSADIIIGCYSNTLSRIMSLSFSDPYLSVGYGVMVNSSELVKHGIEDDPVGYMLENPVKIGVLGGSSHADAARTLFPNCEIVEVFLEEGDDYENAYDKAAFMVADNELFCYFCVELEFVLQYMTYKELSIFTTSFTFTDVSDTYAIGLSKQDGGLLEFINLYLTQNVEFTVTDIISSYIESTGGEE